MKFSVATNFDAKLVRALSAFPVAEMYGKLASDIVGGGRSSYMLAPINRFKFASHVKDVRKQGMGFNYLLNASCLDNIETTKDGQKKIRKLLDWVSEIECTAVTATNPLIIRTIKKCYPALRVRVSVFAGVDHIRKAKYWEDLGVDVICLDSLTVNREFETLKSIRKGVACELELLVNNNCLQSCSLSPTHMNLLCHSSQSGHKEKGFVIDHCVLECSKMKLKDSVNFIRSDWIRPEDLHYYEEIGYHNFKIVERNMPTSLMIQRVQSYAQRRFDGNLLDLIQPYGHKIKSENRQQFNAYQFFWRLGFLLRPFKVRLGELKLLKDLAEKRGMLGGFETENPIYIDNRKLDDFIERFKMRSCRDIDCDQCQYCHQVARKAVSILPSYKKECLDLYQKIDQKLETGEFWYKN